jgi:hypothetical protein
MVIPFLKWDKVLLLTTSSLTEYRQQLRKLQSNLRNNDDISTQETLPQILHFI